MVPLNSHDYSPWGSPILPTSIHRLLGGLKLCSSHVALKPTNAPQVGKIPAIWESKNLVNEVVRESSFELGWDFQHFFLLWYFVVLFFDVQARQDALIGVLQGGTLGNIFHTNSFEHVDEDQTNCLAQDPANHFGANWNPRISSSSFLDAWYIPNSNQTYHHSILISSQFWYSKTQVFLFANFCLGVVNF